MRLTPSQIAMREFMGEYFPFCSPEPEALIERVRKAHEELVSSTGQDFGFDLVRWHEHLRATNTGGYRWSNKHLGIPRQIKETLANAEWQAVRCQLEKEAVTEPEG